MKKRTLFSRYPGFNTRFLSPLAMVIAFSLIGGAVSVAKAALPKEICQYDESTGNTTCTSSINVARAGECLLEVISAPIIGGIKPEGFAFVGQTITLNADSVKIDITTKNCEDLYQSSIRPLQGLSEFRWSVTKPDGTNATLISPSTLHPGLYIDQPGQYTGTLRVCPDGCDISDVVPYAPPVGFKDIPINIRGLMDGNIPPETVPLPVGGTPRPIEDFSDYVDGLPAVDKCLGGPPLGGGAGFFDPEWVTVEPFVDVNSYKTLEGVVQNSKFSRMDAPLNHSEEDYRVGLSGHDFIFHVLPDPDYRDLLSSTANNEVIEVEWEDSAVAHWARPATNNRVSVFGYWIHDCGHPPFNTEIHPPVGIAVHRSNPIKLPTTITDKVTATLFEVGSNVYVPGIITDIYFNKNSGKITQCPPGEGVIEAYGFYNYLEGGGYVGLHQPAREELSCGTDDDGHIAYYCPGEGPNDPDRYDCSCHVTGGRDEEGRILFNCGGTITTDPDDACCVCHVESVLTEGPCIQEPSSIARTWELKIYLPRSPQMIYAEAGIFGKPPVPLYVGVVGVPGYGLAPDPEIIYETNEEGAPYLRVRLDLSQYPFETYGKKIVAGWVYPAPDNWNLEQWKLRLTGLTVYNDGDNFGETGVETEDATVSGNVPEPGNAGDWWFDFNTNNPSQYSNSLLQEWTRIFACMDCVDDRHHLGFQSGTEDFDDRPWITGSYDDRSLGPDILVYPDYFTDIDVPTPVDNNIIIHTSGFQENGLVDDSTGLINAHVSPRDYNSPLYNSCMEDELLDESTWGVRVHAYSGCTDYSLSYEIVPGGVDGTASVGPAILSQIAQYFYDRYGVGVYTKPALNMPVPSPIAHPSLHPEDIVLDLGNSPVPVLETPLFRRQQIGAHSRTTIRDFYEVIKDEQQERPAKVDWLLNWYRQETDRLLDTPLRPDILAQLPILRVALPPDLWDRYFAGLTVNVQLPPDATPPVVTPPADITILATETGGTSGSASAVLSAFLTSGSAVDDIDPAPERLLPQTGGVDANNNILFPIGTTTVTFRFRNYNGGIGTATATVTVVLGQPRLSGAITSQNRIDSGKLSVELRLTNNGTGHARNIMLNGVRLRTLSGTGTVTYDATSSPVLPYAIGNLDVGATAYIKLILNVPSTVTKFSIAENGTVQDVAGTSYSYSIGQAVVP